MKAFLLAAGRGTRISRMIEEIPKCTLPVDGEPLIRYTANMLLEAGFELVVCVGYRRQKIFEALEGLPVTYYFNPFYEVTNSIASLWFAREEIKSDMIIMNADVYITKNLLNLLIADKRDAVMMIDSTRVKTGDYFFGTSDNGCIVKYGKDLPIQMRNCEYVGLAKINHNFIGAFRERLSKFIEDSKYTMWWENVLYSFTETKEIHTLDVNGEFWAEIDFFDDYERILNHIDKEKKSGPGRIYAQKVDIKVEHTKSFYDKRAKSIGEMDNPYVAVLLGDQNPEHAVEWNKFEKDFIFPQLHINEDTAVLDIGSGIGRWAESVIPACGEYVGTDFSDEMVRLAQRRCKFEGKKYGFLNLSFQETVKHRFERKFDCVIIGGVCMYINDADLKQCFDGLMGLVSDHCVMYLTETVAAGTRLTLDDLPSDALKANYDVIYRTRGEYCEFYKPIEQAGFRVVKQDYLPHLNDEKQFNETNRWFTIFER